MKIWNIFKIFGLVFLLFFLICLPYYIVFREFGISKSTASWGEYGSYIAGISSVLNLAVFIYLTVYVARLGDLNSKSQISAQKKIIISQFRQTELEKLNDKLDDAFLTDGIKDKASVNLRFVNAAVHLANFANQKKYLFPILENPEIRKTIEDLIAQFAEFAEIVEKSYGNPNLEKTLNELYIDKVQNTTEMKSRLIEKLNLFIVNDIGE